jgi:hypothetical protein
MNILEHVVAARCEKSSFKKIDQCEKSSYLLKGSVSMYVIGYHTTASFFSLHLAKASIQ